MHARRSQRYRSRVQDQRVTDQGLVVSEEAGKVEPVAEEIDMGSIEEVAGETDREPETEEEKVERERPKGPQDRRCSRCERDCGGWINQKPRSPGRAPRHGIDSRAGR